MFPFWLPKERGVTLLLVAERVGESQIEAEQIYAGCGKAEDRRLGRVPLVE